MAIAVLVIQAKYSTNSKSCYIWKTRYWNIFGLERKSSNFSEILRNLFKNSHKNGVHIGSEIIISEVMYSRHVIKVIKIHKTAGSIVCYCWVIDETWREGMCVLILFDLVWNDSTVPCCWSECFVHVFRELYNLEKR